MGEWLDQLANVKNQFIGMTYDAAGNLINDGGSNYTYDAENRLLTAGGVTYTYDGDGRRVKKSSGTLYWYDVNGNVLVETQADPAGTWNEAHVYFGGKRILRHKLSGAVRYLFADHLGSASVVGNFNGAIMEEIDFYPYGGTRVISSAEPNPYKFAGKERDGENALDYFIARHYSSSSGRFLQSDEFSGGPVDAFSSQDPLPPGPLPYADVSDPQSINKYAYTYNNPIRFVDPNGHGIRELWDGIKAFFRDLVAPHSRLHASKGEDTTPLALREQSEAGLGLDRETDVRQSAQGMAQGIDLTTDVLLVADLSGMGSAGKAMVQGDNAGAVLAAGSVFLGGSGGKRIAVSEAKQLVGGWSAGSFDRIADSIRYHFGKHMKEVGAKDVWQYLRKAEGFKQNLRGATTKQLENGVTRYYKNGRYIDLDAQGRIVSFGAQ